MTFNTYDKLDVACEQLEVALRLYFEAEEYFAVITLAGAAEEVLGAHLKAKGERTSLQDLVQGAVRISKVISGRTAKTADILKTANYPRNAAKHMDGEGDAQMRVYLKRDAADLLSRAVDNYYRLMEHYEIQETELVRRFNFSGVSDNAA